VRPVTATPIWFRVPDLQRSHPRPRFLCCGVDGLAPAYLAFKTALSLCRIVDRLEVLHIYSDGLSASIPPSQSSYGFGARQRSGLKPDGLPALPSPLVPPQSPPGPVTPQFRADLSPGAIKTMYEAELKLDPGHSPLRRVVCLARPSGSTIADELVNYINHAGCDLLVVGYEHFSALTSRRHSGGADGGVAGNPLRNTMPAGSLSDLHNASGPSGDRFGHKGSVIDQLRASSLGSRGDRYRVTPSDLR